MTPGAARADRADPGVRVGSAEHGEVGEGGGRAERLEGVERVLLATRDDAPGRGRGDGAARGVARGGVLDRGGAVDRILDRAVARAPAEVALQLLGEVVARLEGLGRDDHARRAEAALVAARGDEGLLDGVRVLGGAQARDGRDLSALGAMRRGDAGMDGDVVEQHGARAAVSRVASLLHLEAAVLAQEGAQHLTRARDRVDRPAVHGRRHPVTSPSTSIASRRPCARRQSAAPCASPNQSSIPATAAASSSSLGGAAKASRRGRSVAALTVMATAPSSSCRPTTTTPDRPSGESASLRSAERAQRRGGEVDRAEDLAGAQGGLRGARHEVENGEPPLGEPARRVGGPQHRDAVEACGEGDERARGKAEADVPADRARAPDLEARQQRLACGKEQRVATGRGQGGERAGRRDPQAPLRQVLEVGPAEAHEVDDAGDTRLRLGEQPGSPAHRPLAWREHEVGRRARHAKRLHSTRSIPSSNPTRVTRM